MDEVILAVDDTTVGTGATPEEALENLKKYSSYTIDFDDVVFYKATEIKVKTQMIILE